ncbi:AAA family ATPase [uncultured Bacteroides sp.]|jgi:helicase|uniref:AAA family ATPase n=1 Tax=uncultured Bacteroides sp. TaxID=162156 RepID=UPI002620F4E0|nr:AAA family ATPase [uncultured Bacteroides sp.]
MQKSKFTLTEGQQHAFDKLLDFVRDKEAKIFILKGYAGTGKTSMMKVLIGELTRRDLKFSLLASTGRAAKILSNATGKVTKTVHGEIYRYQDLNQDLETIVEKREKTGIDSTGQLFLNFELNQVLDNKKEERFYIIDEASMIPDREDKMATQALFGSGRLLKDLLDYDLMGKFIFVGDACQLPPITQNISPALSVSYFKEVFSIQAAEVELTEVIRQERGNDIILSAQKVRELYYVPQPWKWAKFPFRNYRNIHLLGSQVELIDLYIRQIKKSGQTVQLC